MDDEYPFLSNADAWSHLPNLALVPPKASFPESRQITKTAPFLFLLGAVILVGLIWCCCDDGCLDPFGR